MPSWKIFLVEMLTSIFRLARFLIYPASKLLMRSVYLSGMRAGCQFAVPASTQFDGPVRVTGTGKVKLGEYCRLGRDVLFETTGDGQIVVGERVRINAGSVLTAHAGIQIGDDSLIGEYVSIRDANHGLKTGELIRKQPHESARIRIGRDVWIGRGCCVLKGILIDDGAVVGANSVLTQSVPKGSIFAGIPAKSIGNRPNVR